MIGAGAWSGCRRLRVLVPLSLGIIAVAACNDLLGNNEGSFGSDGGAEPSATGAGGLDATAPATANDLLDASGTCAVAQKQCDGTCVSAADPLYGCGAPGCDPCALAHATATCAGSACGIGACLPGYADCNGIADDGCEVDLSKATSCGACNAMCGPSAPNCAPIGPSFQCTMSCPSSAPLQCGTQCVDPMTSATHCGTCDNVCTSGANGVPGCAKGVCTSVCSAQFHACGVTCARDTDPTACGPTCVMCPVPPDATATCVANACAMTCATGTADCDKLPANGCEATLATDSANCNACGVVCPGGGACVKGICQKPSSDSGGGGTDSGGGGTTDASDQ